MLGLVKRSTLVVNVQFGSVAQKWVDEWLFGPPFCKSVRLRFRAESCAVWLTSTFGTTNITAARVLVLFIIHSITAILLLAFTQFRVVWCHPPVLIELFLFEIDKDPATVQFLRASARGQATLKLMYVLECFIRIYSALPFTLAHSAEFRRGYPRRNLKPSD